MIHHDILVPVFFSLQWIKSFNLAPSDRKAMVVWEVVGGAQKGGVLVRLHKDG